MLIPSLLQRVKLHGRDGETFLVVQTHRSRECADLVPLGKDYVLESDVPFAILEVAEDHIETTRHKDRQEQLGSQLDAMARLNAIGQLCLRSGKEIDGVLGEVVETAVFLTGADKGNLQLFDAACDGLKLVAHRGFKDPFLKFFHVVTIQAAVCELAMRSRRRVIVPDITKSEVLVGSSSLQILLEAGVRAVQSTPLVSSSGMLLGMISTHYSVPTEPTEPQLALMDLLARQTADYIERKQAERALRASAEQLRQFVNAVPSGITRCSCDLRYLSANQGYAAIVGLPLDQIVGRPIIEVMGAEAFETIRPKIERVLHGDRIEYEADVPFSAAGHRYLHVVYTPETDEHGDVIGWIASVMDITAFRQAQDRLAKVEKLAAAGQLAASLAHEINNPLNAVLNCLYLLEAGTSDDETTKNLINAASKELARLGRIVNQSLSYYRAGTVVQKIDLALLVRESLHVFADKFEHSGIKINEKVNVTPVILGYPDEIRQVIDNLLLNAVEAMPQGGSLSVAVRPSRSWRSAVNGVRLTIADTGCGITARTQERIFEPFFTTKAEKGTGLGLWVVRGILSKHGATIQVRSSSKPSRSGTVISILYPATGSLDSQSTRSEHLVQS